MKSKEEKEEMMKFIKELASFKNEHLEKNIKAVSAVISKEYLLNPEIEKKNVYEMLNTILVSNYSAVSGILFSVIKTSVPDEPEQTEVMNGVKILMKAHLDIAIQYLDKLNKPTA